MLDSHGIEASWASFGVPEERPGHISVPFQLQNLMGPEILAVAGCWDCVQMAGRALQRVVEAQELWRLVLGGHFLHGSHQFHHLSAPRSMGFSRGRAARKEIL